MKEPSAITTIIDYWCKSFQDLPSRQKTICHLLTSYLRSSCFSKTDCDYYHIGPNKVVTKFRYNNDNKHICAYIEENNFGYWVEVGIKNFKHYARRQITRRHINYI